MGMYTELMFGGLLYKNTSDEVINIIINMCHKCDTCVYDYNKIAQTDLSVSKLNEILRVNFIGFGSPSSMTLSKNNYGQWRLDFNCIVDNYKESVNAFVELLLPYMETLYMTKTFQRREE